MPILKQEDDIFPDDLLEESTLAKLSTDNRLWWCVYTISRREKDLMRKLRSLKIPHYGPMLPKRYRSPNGRLRTSFIPMFANYVFMLASEEERGIAMTTNCISACTQVVQNEVLIKDLRQICCIVDHGKALTPEAKLQAGSKVRVRNGPFAGLEGDVIRREGKTRLLLSVRYLEQGVSMEMDEALLEAI
ncbi:antitermination protein NusG [Mariniblastus sp.]|nr:antitermination protein NusG [Mariniblastus sp.]